MKEEIDSIGDEIIIIKYPHGVRSQSMHITSVNLFKKVPTLHPKNTNEWPSPMILAKPSMCEIKEDELHEGDEEENHKIISGKSKMTVGKAISDKNVIYLATISKSKTVEMSPIEPIERPIKKRSSILFSLEKNNKRKSTMS